MGDDSIRWEYPALVRWGSAACGDAEWPEASCEYLVDWSQSACCAARSCGRDWEELWLGARFTRLTGEARECAALVWGAQCDAERTAIAAGEVIGSSAGASFRGQAGWPSI